MAVLFKTGTKVRQKAPTIEGTVAGNQVIGDESMVRVEYIADGEQHERYFREDELEAVPDAAGQNE